MIEVMIKIDGKEYTREEAEQLYKELAAFLGKPEKVIERIVEKPVLPHDYSNPWIMPKRYEIAPSPPPPWEINKVWCW